MENLKVFCVIENLSIAPGTQVRNQYSAVD